MSVAQVYGRTMREDATVVYSVVTPVYNQADVIVRNVDSVIRHTRGLFEIIIVLDYCFDETEANLSRYFLEMTEPVADLVRITVFKVTGKPLFETKCDNIGFRRATGTFCLEIQADMEMTEPGYNLRLAAPFFKYNNVIAVSGRAAMPMFGPPGKTGVGKMNGLIERSVAELGVARDKFYVHESAIRGPLLIHRGRMAELGFLNETEFFLNNSDHDLMARAWLTHRWICGYVAIDFSAPLNEGTLRNIYKYADTHPREWRVNRDEFARLSAAADMAPGLKRHTAHWVPRKMVLLDL